jgi:hypothetical protein
MSDPRSVAGYIGAHESWARTPDRSARTAKARAAADARFEREADPDGVLDPAERARRADHLRKAHFARLALKSAQSRRASKEAVAASRAAQNLPPVVIDESVLERVVQLLDVIVSLSPEAARGARSEPKDAA